MLKPKIKVVEFEEDIPSIYEIIRLTEKLSPRVKERLCYVIEGLVLANEIDKNSREECEI